MVRAHRIDCGRRQQVRIAAADHHDRHAGQCVELLPERGQRLCEVGCLERGGQLHVVIGDDASACLLERPARERGPVVVAQFGELAPEQTAQDVGRVAHARRRRELADIALDPDQSFEVDHGADVVEHAAGDRSRTGHREQHCQQTAARRSNEDRPGDVERGQCRDEIGEFDRQAVICRIAVIVGSAAATGVEGDHAPRSVRIARQPSCQRLEVSAGARKSRQADHRQGGRGSRPIAAHMEPQPVLGRDKDACCSRGAHSGLSVRDNSYFVTQSRRGI